MSAPDPASSLPVPAGETIDDVLAWLGCTQLSARQTAEQTRDAAQLVYDRLREYAVAAGMTRIQAREAALQVSEPIGRAAAELARTSAYLRLTKLRITTAAPADDDPAAPTPATPGGTPMQPQPAGGEPRHGGYDPSQPRAADGKWTKDDRDDPADVPDVLGVADDETVIGSDQVKGTGPVPTNLVLIDDPGEQVTSTYSWRGGQYVEVRTPAADKPDDVMAYPILAPDEAEVAAGHLEELAGIADAGGRPVKPSKHGKAAQRIQRMLDDGRLSPNDKIGVGDEEEFPLTTADLLTLLRNADPAGSVGDTVRKVDTKASIAAGGESGAVWIALEPKGDRIAVTGIEGKGEPDDEFWQPYTSHHTPAGARELAGKLRRFADAARQRQTAPKETRS